VRKSAQAQNKDLPPPARATRELANILAWTTVLGMGILFFWMNTRAPVERGQLFVRVGVFAHWPHRYCDLGATLASLESSFRGHPVAGPCSSPPGAPVHDKGVVWLGFGVAAGFLLSLAMTLRVSRPWHAFYFGLLIVSPPVFLALERGSLDVLIFIALVMAVLTARSREWLGYAVFFVMGIWQSYPFAAVLGLLRPSRRSWLYVLAVMTGALLFFFLPLGQIRVTGSVGVARFAWGFPVIFQLGPDILRTHGFHAAYWSRPEMLRFTAVCCLLLFAAGWQWRRPLQAFLESEDQIARMCFITGCAIYAFCFVSFVNYESRSVLILLLVPHLLQTTRKGGYERILAFSGLGVILAIFLLSWYHFDDYPFLAHQIFYWLLFCFCAPLCLAALLSAWPKDMFAPVLGILEKYGAPSLQRVASHPAVTWIGRTKMYILAWTVVLGLGVLFFWMNTRVPAERGQLFWEAKVFAHWPDRYCDLGIALAFLESDYQGHPVPGPCGAQPGALIYGKGVLWMGRLGLNRLTVGDTVWLGFGLAAAFLLSLGLTLRVSRTWHALYYGLLIFSPPIFLGLERGNLDLLIFIALVVAIILTARFRDGLGYAVLFVVGTWKFYPFVAVLGLLRPSRRSWLYLMVVAAGAVIFFLASLDQIRVAASIGPARFAWGFPVIFQLGPDILRTHGFDAADWFRPEMLRFMAVCCLLLFVAAWRWRAPLEAFLESEDQIARMCFITGCAIYAGCFVISVNYEYRNVFILLLVPHLLQATRKRGYERVLAFSGLGVILAVFLLSWYHYDDYPFLAYQIFYWLLFCFCAPLCLAALLSAWPKDIFTRQASRSLQRT
jgi:hypothetical protein